VKHVERLTRIKCETLYLVGCTLRILTDVSGYCRVASSTVKNILLTLEDEADMLSRNACKELLPYAA